MKGPNKVLNGSNKVQKRFQQFYIYIYEIRIQKSSRKDLTEFQQEVSLKSQIGSIKVPIMF